MQIQDFFRGGGGGGGPGPTARKQSGQCFFSPQLIFYRLQSGSNGFITEKTILFQESRGVPTFSRLVPTFSRGGVGGVQMLISVETQIACEFPRWGSRPPIPPLDPHMDYNIDQKRFIT